MIVCAAIAYEQRTKIFSAPPPARHHNILHNTMLGGLRDGEQGFIAMNLYSLKAQFVTREEAYPIARDAGQLLPKSSIESDEKRLFTEDMW